MTFKANTSYKLKEADRYDDEYGEGFDRVETYEGTDGCYIADCWIVNEAGEVHPGYNDSPVPVRFDDIIPASARRGSNAQRERSAAFWR